MIDGGPLRTSRPAGRQGIYQDEPVHYQPEEPQVAESATVMEQRPRQPQPQRQVYVEPDRPAVPKKPRNLSWLKWLVAFVVIAAIGAGLWFFMPSQKNIEAAIASDKYQAVFLSNGQVYFGKLTIVNSDYMKLTNVYYLERQLTAANGNQANTEQDQSTPTGDNNFQLLKYSDVLYGSEDAMVISKDDIIRFENLRSDGVVAKAIANRR